jgi:hypothetical protein
MKELFLTDWKLMRMLRVIGGIAILITGIVKHDTIIGAFGLFFAYQGFFNVSCCGGGNCANSVIDTAKMKQSIETDEVVYEEIK